MRISTDTEIAAEVDRNYFGKIKSAIIMFISYISLGVYAAVGYLGDLVSVRWIFFAMCVAIFGGLVVKLGRENVLRGILKTQRQNQLP